MKIKFFSYLRENCGDSIVLKLSSEKTSIKEIKKLIIKKLGEKALILESNEIICAVNHEFIENDYKVVNIEDEVAFFPPVTGG